LTRKTNQAGRQADDAEQNSVEPTPIFSIDQESATIPEIQRSQRDHAVRSAWPFQCVT
jgi:hypothetical protein